MTDTSVTEPKYAAQGTKRRVKTPEAEVETETDFLDMETAPKDGSKIVVRMTDGQEWRVKWRPTRSFDRSLMRYVPSGYWIGADDSARIEGEAVGWKS